MADYYLEFAAEFEFNTKRAAKLFTDLLEMVDHIVQGDVQFGADGLELRGVFFKPDHEVFVRMMEAFRKVDSDLQDVFRETEDYINGTHDWRLHDGTDVWVAAADENGDVDTLMLCAQAALRMPGEEDTVLALTWSTSCSRGEPGAFGGGYGVITAEDRIFWDTHTALEAALEKVQK